MPTASPSTSAPSSATPRHGPARSPRPPRSSGAPARTGSSRGCWTSVAASRPGSTTAARHWRRTAQPSSGTWPPRSATAGRPRSPSPAAGSLPTPASSSPPWSACVHRGGTRWVFLDAGVFTGLVETLDEAIRYPLATDVDAARPARACWPARPATARTCSTRTVMVELPLALAEGDQVRFRWPGSTPAATRPSASTASPRCRRRSSGMNVPRHGRPVLGRLLASYAAARGHRAALAAAAGAGLGPVRRRPHGRWSSAWPARPGWRRTSCCRGGRLAGRPRPAGPAGAGDLGPAAGRPGRRGGRGRGRPPRAGACWPRHWRCCRHADLPGDRGRAARAGRRATGPGHRAAGDDRGLGLGRRRPRWAGCCSRSRCGRGPWWSPPRWPPSGWSSPPGSPSRARWSGPPTRWRGCFARCCAAARPSVRWAWPGC